MLLKDKDIQVVETEALMRYSGGDARKLLNVLEIVVDSFADRSPIVIDNKSVTESIQENMAIYDKDGEMHYDIISAFIKSIRGSDPNAAIYYLARMIEGGEDPLFIARRLCLSASEDVGLANPNALLLANACFEVVSKIGMPEGRIPLAETTVYLASSPKSNGSYMALENALALVRETGDLPVPLPIRNAPTQLMKDLNYSDGYKYAHDYPPSRAPSSTSRSPTSTRTSSVPISRPAGRSIIRKGNPHRSGGRSSRLSARARVRSGVRRLAGRVRTP